MKKIILAALLLCGHAFANTPAYLCVIKPQNGHKGVTFQAILKSSRDPLLYDYAWGHGNPQERVADEKAKLQIKDGELVVGSVQKDAKVVVDKLQATIDSVNFHVEIKCTPKNFDYLFLSQENYWFTENIHDYSPSFALREKNSKLPRCYVGKGKEALTNLTARSFYGILPDKPGVFSREHLEGFKREDIKKCLEDVVLDLSTCLNNLNVPGLAYPMTNVSRFSLSKGTIRAERAGKECLDFVSARDVDDDSSCTKWGEWQKDDLKVEIPICK